MADKTRRAVIVQCLSELEALLDANVIENEYDWNGYVGQACGALGAALECLTQEDKPTEDVTRYKQPLSAR